MRKPRTTSPFLPVCIPRATTDYIHHETIFSLGITSMRETMLLVLVLLHFLSQVFFSGRVSPLFETANNRKLPTESLVVHYIYDNENRETRGEIIIFVR